MMELISELTILEVESIETKQYDHFLSDFFDTSNCNMHFFGCVYLQKRKVPQ